MEKVELDIVSNGMDGEGIARKDGKVFFIDGAIEGEKVLAIITKENKNFSTAKLDQILEKSQFRCKPECKFFDKCGGCNLQHMAYKKQLKIKRQNVQNLFNKLNLKYEVLNCKKSQLEYGYRNKLTLYLNENNSLCFYKKNSKELIEINNCCLVDNKFNYLIKKLNIFFKDNREFSFVLKGVSIRKINDFFIISLILTKKTNLDNLQNYLKLFKINYALYYCINNKKNSNIPLEPCYFVGGENKIYLTEFNIKYPVYPLSFLQVNNEIKKKIYSQIVEFVKGHKNVLDAYSGAGLLSAILAKSNEQVFAVEINPSAHEASRQLCKMNNIQNVINICADCAKELPQLIKNYNFDCIVLDPARAGVDKVILNTINNAGIKNVIYLSCNPATLARDLKILVEGGYNITFAQPYDMFPQTANVETLVKLEYKGN